MIGKIAGAAIGFATGGPVGALKGMQVGDQVENVIKSVVSDKDRFEQALGQQMAMMGQMVIGNMQAENAELDAEISDPDFA